jgi:hypothetical protein
LEVKVLSMGLLRRGKTLNELLLEDAGLAQTAPPEPPRVEASERAARFVRSHGGSVYVWLDKSGLSHTTTTPPKLPIEFTKIEGAGFALYQDTAIMTPQFWTLVYLRLLRRVEPGWEHMGGDATSGGM